MATIVWRVAVTVACAVALVGLVPSTSSGSTKRERKVERRLVGTWRVVSIVTEDAQGRVVGHQYGRNPVGKITYTRDRNFWAMVAPRDAPKNISPAIWYTGKFRVDLRHHRVVHHVQYATLPSWEGSDQLRPYTLHGRRLSLATAPPGEGRIVLRWKKVR
jgi:hypothetical protein